MIYDCTVVPDGKVSSWYPCGYSSDEDKSKKGFTVRAIVETRKLTGNLTEYVDIGPPVKPTDISPSMWMLLPRLTQELKGAFNQSKRSKPQEKTTSGGTDCTDDQDLHWNIF